MFYIFRTHADPVILDHEAVCTHRRLPFIKFIHRQGYPAALTGVLGGIFKNIDQHLLQTSLVTEYQLMQPLAGMNGYYLPLLLSG